MIIEDNNWEIVQECNSVSKTKHYEGAFCQGNGYMSMRASFEEGINGAP